MRCLWLLPLVALLIGVTDSVLENKLKNPDQWKKNLKSGAEAFLGNVNEYRLMLRPYLTMIPVVGGLVAAVVDFPLLVAAIVQKQKSVSEAKVIQSQIKDLKLTMNDQHVMQLLNANPIHQYAANIEAAWDNYQVYIKNMMDVLESPTNEKTEQEIKDLDTKLVEFYSNHLTDTDKLANKLADNKFQSLLAKTTHCHDNELEDFMIWANKFVFFGNIMNKVYYKLTEPPRPARLSHIDEVTYKAALGLFKVREHCLSQIEEAVKEDLDRLLSPEVARQLKKKEKTYQNLAIDIHNFFAATYRLYDWFVVLYKTKDVKRVIREKKHILTMDRFWTDEKLNVAMHWQLKGENRHSPMVKQAIDSCVPPDTSCKTVLEKLNACSKMVGGAKLEKWISAVHIFKGQETQSLDGQPTPYVDPQGTTSFYHEGRCKGRLKKQRFFAMIRSSNDATQKDDCVGRNCGNGVCKVVNIVGICECNPGYYGESCEEKLENYNPSQVL